MEGPYDKRRTSAKCWHWGPTGHCDNQAKDIHRAYTAPHDVKTSQREEIEEGACPIFCFFPLDSSGHGGIHL